jgi:hypothetical protein
MISLVLQIIVMAHLCIDSERICIQFLMTADNCAVLVVRHQQKLLGPFSVRCLPVIIPHNTTQ